VAGDDDGCFVSAPFGGCAQACLGHRPPFDHRHVACPDISRCSRTTCVRDHSNGRKFTTFVRIRTELEAKGEVFLTDSDTEGPLEAFREWNVGCLDKLNGHVRVRRWDDLEKNARSWSATAPDQAAILRKKWRESCLCLGVKAIRRQNSSRELDLKVWTILNVFFGRQIRRRHSKISSSCRRPLSEMEGWQVHYK